MHAEIKLDKLRQPGMVNTGRRSWCERCKTYLGFRLGQWKPRMCLLGWLTDALLLAWTVVAMAWPLATPGGHEPHKADKLPNLRGCCKRHRNCKWGPAADLRAFWCQKPAVS